VSEQFIVLIAHRPAGNTYLERSLHVNGLGLEPEKATCFGTRHAYACDGCHPEGEYDASQSHFTQCSYLRLSTPVFRLLTQTSEAFLLHSIHQDTTLFAVYRRAMSAFVNPPPKTIRSPDILVCGTKSDSARAPLSRTPPPPRLPVFPTPFLFFHHPWYFFLKTFVTCECLQTHWSKPIRQWEMVSEPALWVPPAHAADLGTWIPRPESPQGFHPVHMLFAIHNYIQASMVQM